MVSRIRVSEIQLTPGDAGFDAEIAPFNRAIAHRPALAVGAACASDVAAAVTLAASEALPVTVQATGHGAVMAADGGLLISTRRMRGLSIDAHARRARVEAGLRWGEIVRETAKLGLAPLNGSSATVGAVGYLTGGGLGPLSRAHGLAVDHVRAFDLVTPDGRLRRVDAESEPELFWAVRGGKANFGVVTAAEIDLFPVARLYGGGLYFPAAAIPALLARYQEWVAELPEQAYAAFALLRLPRLPHVHELLGGRLVGHLRVAHLGSAEQAERDLAPMRAVARPLLDTVREMGYDEIATVHHEPDHPVPSWGRGALVRELTPAAAQALSAAAGPDSDSPLTVVELRPLGGAVARAPERPSAVDRRDAAFTLNVLGPLRPDVRDVVPAAGERVLAAMAPWLTGGSLINFQGSAVAPDQVAAAWTPETFARLSRLKREVDPHHLFRTGHVIVPGAHDTDQEHR
ncbi:FAD-binding oxidoreductase [Conexibacter woesei]|uniref:FAD linked oxidase domain protein n=1 Tax=Conexibacter woesei (strain DSM 14684 / CCUG 47730 / CIP 108061 / JCM 11494 / NBRC 100937 / ID131577) TaxID=469383 RepID=D3F7J1_CONWI|nr:FAD linked oxidase domain protein [Conexibacter woesei DSM 14684]